jgi:L-glyceraldehyde 3-phosphate reductase
MTPLAETAQALDQLVRQGKALYIGISKYSSQETQEIIDIFKELKTPFIIHQPRYNMFDRKAERGLFTTLGENKKGAVGFSSLAQGLLSDKYLKGIPNNSRANKVTIPFLTTEKVEPTINTVQKLNQIAQRRGQTLPHMALVLIGASNPKQVIENVKALDNLSFSPEELLEIDHALSEYAPNQA